MKLTRRRILTAALAVSLLTGGATWWHLDHRLHYLDGHTQEFVALFVAPPAADSPATRRELDELLELQRRRTEAQAEAARADRKTEIARFYGALGLSADRSPSLPALQRLTRRAEDDVRPYVRAAKYRFRRLRPYEIEPRLQPCIDNVQADLSYPSGHATYGYAMALLLAAMVPERRAALLARADEFARQRMVCGVHFASDLAAGRTGAEWLVRKLLASPGFARDADAAAAELRGALGLGPLDHQPRAAQAGAGVGAGAAAM
jgi:acid phosphatase (class A)